MNGSPASVSKIEQRVPNTEHNYLKYMDIIIALKSDRV